MSKEPFEYGGYHFIPERTLRGAEAGFYAISKKLCEDRELDFARKVTPTRANFLIHTKLL